MIPVRTVEDATIVLDGFSPRDRLMVSVNNLLHYAEVERKETAAGMVVVIKAGERVSV